MKKSILLGLGVCTLALGGVAALVGQKGAVETKADDTDYIYLDNSQWYQKNERYAAYFFNDAEDYEWVNFTWDESVYANKVAIPATSYSKVRLCRMNGGTQENTDANRWDYTAALDNHTGIYRPDGMNGANTNGHWLYVLTVGETTTYMVPHGTGSVKRTVTASANDEVSLKYRDDQSAGTLNAEAKASNNMVGTNVKVGGEVTIYVVKDGWSTWASGYAPSTTVIQDFCDALLALDCNAKDLSGLNWSGEGVKEAINGATVTLGDGVSYATYGNVLNEAATRYAHLINKGATPIDGVTLAAASQGVVGIITDKQNNLLPVIVLSSVALVSVGGLLVARRRKED